MTEEEAWRFKEEGCTFLDYKDIQEYIEDIVVCLVYSSWHYSEERARELCKEGMAWISKVVENHPAMNLVGTNTLFYLEQVMMEYVYGNKMLIRKTPALQEQVRTILNFMVSKSSVTGFVLRDMVN